MIGQCETEIIELHRFFERWFNGELEDSPEAFSRLSDVLSERFQMVSPGGETLERREVLAGVRRQHGSHRAAAEPYRIEIRAVDGRFRGPGVALVTYQEWQWVDGEVRARASSALFRERKDTPEGVEWLHLHETWLPGEGG